MNVFNFYLTYKLNKNIPRVIALGKFSSFHLGHQKIFKKTIDIASNLNGESIVMIFPDIENQKEILTQKEKKKLLERFNFDHVMFFNPTQRNFKVRGEEFINFLKNNLNVTDTVTGKSFLFGSKRKFNISNLNNNFNSWVLPTEMVGDKIISSTLAKLMIQDKDFENLDKVLGYKFYFSGKVIHGKKMGRELGCRTANTTYHKSKIDVPYGVYMSKSILNGKQYKSITSISTNPTFSGDQVSYETHLFGYEGEDFYGETLMVELTKHLRDIIKFSNVDELKEQIKKDIKDTIKYFSK